eukprot:gene733-biopygen479
MLAAVLKYAWYGNDCGGKQEECDTPRDDSVESAVESEGSVDSVKSEETDEERMDRETYVSRVIATTPGMYNAYVTFCEEEGLQATLADVVELAQVVKECGLDTRYTLQKATPEDILLTEWLNSVVEVTGDSRDAIWVGDLKALWKETHVGAEANVLNHKLVKAYVATKAGAEWKRIGRIKTGGGSFVKNGVVKGCTLREKPIRAYFIAPFQAAIHIKVSRFVEEDTTNDNVRIKAKVIADKEAARLSRVSMRKASLDELDDHIMSSQDLAHVFKCCASVVPKGQLRDKLVPNGQLRDNLVVSCTTDDILGVTHALLNRKLTGFITKLCIDLKDLPLDVIIAHAGSISGAVMADVAAAVGDFPKLTHAVFSRNYGDDIKQACIASQDAEIRKQVHCMVANIVKRICVRDWDSMFRGVFEDAFDFFVYSGVLDFGHGHLSGYDDRGGGWIYPP